MKISSSNTKRLSVISVLLATVAMITLSGIPSAMAMNTPGLLEDNDPSVVGSTIQFTVTAQAAFTNGVNFRVYDPNNGPLFGAGCPLPGASGGLVYELRNSAGVPATYGFTNAGANIKVIFGSGAPIVPTVSAGASIGPGGGFRWVEISDGDITNPSDTTAILGLYAWATCGFDGAMGPGSQYNAIDSFTVQEPVGGKLIPIDYTALVIAGATSNAIWILPLLVLAAGGAFALLKFQVVRRS